MAVLSSLPDGFSPAPTPMNLLYALVGVLLGTAVGVLPGLGPAMTVALLLPVTFALEPASAFIMFAGIYYGGMYGGCRGLSPPTPPVPSSCSPASTTAACTAAPPRRSC